MTYRLIATLVASLFFCSNTTAQDLDNEKTLKLRPLSILTEAALQNAPEIRANAVDVTRQTLAWQVQKRSWADLIVVNGQTMYGNGSVLDATDNGTVTRYLLNDRKNVNMNITLGFRITGGDVVNRRDKARLQHMQLDRLAEERRQTELLIREQAATLYTNLELALKIIKLKAEGVENHRLALSVAEKYFKEGTYQPTEYATLLAKLNSAQEQYEQAKSEAKKLSLVLKNLVNIPIYEK